MVHIESQPGNLEFLIGTPYEFDSGIDHLSMSDGRLVIPEKFNCQALTSIFDHLTQGRDVLQPETKHLGLSREGFLHLGEHVIEPGLHTIETIGAINEIQFGAHMYAMPHRHVRTRLREDTDTRLKKLHQAIYLGAASNLRVREIFPWSSQKFMENEILIFHTTPRRGTSLWTLDHFLARYTVIAIKNVNSEKV